MDISVVIPCLNESETIQICIDKIKYQLKQKKLNGEIIISDNGSTDGSIEIANKNKVKIINVKEKGYGNAVNSGVKIAKGKYILIADADNSYDFNDLPKFYDKINEGFDIVQGCRLPGGGGKIEKNAMPISHRLIGNPMFTFLTKLMYQTTFNDVYCGMKILRNEFYKDKYLFSHGMVWCLEILIKSKIWNARCAEIPLTLYKDGRKKGKSHLNTISDGLKTLKFILICSPKSIYLVPALIMILFPIIGIILSIIENNFIFFLNSNLLILLSSTFLSTQLVMLGLYSTLRAETLGISKKGVLDNFFNFFSLRLSLFLNMTIILLVNFLGFNDKILYLTDENSLLFQVFISLICLNIIFNSFFISLLRINK